MTTETTTRRPTNTSRLADPLAALLRRRLRATGQPTLEVSVVETAPGHVVIVPDDVDLVPLIAVRLHNGRWSCVSTASAHDLFRATARPLSVVVVYVDADEVTPAE